MTMKNNYKVFLKNSPPPQKNGGGGGDQYIINNIFLLIQQSEQNNHSDESIADEDALFGIFIVQWRQEVKGKAASDWCGAQM